MINIVGLKPSFPMVLTLENTFGQKKEIIIDFKVSCTLVKKDLESIKDLLAPVSLDLAT